MGDQVVEVQCYSGASYAERPIALIWQGSQYKISSVLSSQFTPSGKRFEVVLENGCTISLYYQTNSDLWTASGLPG
jgi:hypothetical protein